MSERGTELVYPGMVTDCEMRVDQSRFFVRLDDDGIIVTGGDFG